MSSEVGQAQSTAIFFACHVQLRVHGSYTKGLQACSALSYYVCEAQVSYSIGRRSYEALGWAGAQLEEKSYRGMGHEAWPDELAAVKTFIGKVLP